MSRFMSLGAACCLTFALSSVAHAQAIQAWIPNTFEFFDPCNNEVVLADIEIHLVLTAEGTTINNVKGTAVGQTSGTGYEWNGVSKLQSFETFEGNTLTSVLSGTGRTRLISHGSRPNLLLTTYIELGVVITFDPVTGFPIDFQEINNIVEVIECRGEGH